MNREPIRSPARSVANLEFHHAGDEVNEVARKVVAALEREGVRAVNPAMGFPMEMDRFPGEKIWVVSHKPVAVAAGLGMMGIHRNVIHPKFGNFILLGTVLIAAEATDYDQPIDYNPCLECKLCVAACPVGAIVLTAVSTSRPAIRTTIGSSWAASPIGSRRSPIFLVGRKFRPSRDRRLKMREAEGGISAGIVGIEIDCPLKQRPCLVVGRPGRIVRRRIGERPRRTYS